MRPAEKEIDALVKAAIKYFWSARKKQNHKQGQNTGKKDYGNRGAVTGGAQFNGFRNFVKAILTDNGVPPGDIFDRETTLPGFFRPTKDWDLLVIHGTRLVLTIEFKSHIGPSFGNNFNNRIEEALGNAMDIWTAYREGTFPPQNQPWLGYFFLLEEHPKSIRPVRVREPHFKIRDEFIDASYLKRYCVFCEKLLRERLYNAAAFIISNKINGTKGEYAEPVEYLSIRNFIKSMMERIHTIYS